MATSRRKGRAAALAIALAVVATPRLPAAPASGPATRPAADEAEVRRLIRQLGADDYTLRQQAQEALIEIGAPAVKQLQQALDSPDAEVRMRAEKALAEIRKGAFGRASDAIARSVLWEQDVPGVPSGPPAVAKGAVVLATREGRLHALSPSTGKRLWEGKAHATAVPAAAGRTVYAADADGKLVALDAETGKAKEGFRPVAVVGRPTVADGTIYVLDKSDRLAALDAGTGAVRWRADLPGDAPAEVRAVAGEGVVYVAAGGGHVCALDAAKGKRKWTAKVKGDVLCLVSAERALLVRTEGALHAYGRADGSKLWRLAAPVGGGGRFQTRQVININGKRIVLTSDSNAPGRSLAVAAGTIYAVVDGEVAAVEAATGRRLWSHRPKLAGDAPHGKQQTVVVQGGGRARVQVFVGGNVAGAKPTSLTPPAVVGGELVFGSREGLHALDLKTRRELWRLKTEHPVVSRPVVVGGVVYFVTSDASRLGGLRIVRGAGAVAGSAKLRALRLRAEP